MDPPPILRIKRKRGQDPLQALILQNAPPSKRSKASTPVASPHIPHETRSWYFQLSAENTAPDVSAPVLSEADPTREKRQFVLPKPESEIPNQLAEMLDSFLTMAPPTQKKRRRGGAEAGAEDHVGGAGDASAAVSAETDADADANADADADTDYVFDVYRLSSTTPLTNSNYPQSQIGYIRFFDDAEYGLLQSDDDKDSQGVYSDDEDSNAESFYQNDYPEDEDAGTYSDTYEHSEDEPIIVESAEAVEASAYLKGHVQADQAEPQHYDDLYDDFFDEDGPTVDFLADPSFPDEEYERQSFFQDEEHDELAIHRDRIFGRLQKMIDEQ